MREATAIDRQLRRRDFESEPLARCVRGRLVPKDTAHFLGRRARAGNRLRYLFKNTRRRRLAGASRAFWKERRCTAALWSSWTRASPRGARRARAWAPPPRRRASPRRTRPASFSTEERETPSQSRPQDGQNTRERSTRTADAHIAASNAHLVDLRAHFSGSRSRRRSPCVSCSRRPWRKAPTARKRRRASRRRGGRRAPAPWRAPGSVRRARGGEERVIPDAPHDGEQTRFVLASVSPTALADGARFRDTTRGAPNEASASERVPSAGCRARRRAPPRFETAALVNAAAPPRARRRVARVAAPFVAGLVRGDPPRRAGSLRAA